MAETTTTKKGLDPAITVVAYVCGAIGLIIIFAVTFCILRKIRVNRAKKYIKQQSSRSIPMGPQLTSAPPTKPWSWKEVKANIKAKHRGEERPYPGTAAQPRVSVISNGSVSNGHSNGVSRPSSASTNGSVMSRGQPHHKMHGDYDAQIARHVKHERLRKRIQAKQERRQMKERQKEIKRDLTLLLEGQRLPGDEFPGEAAQSSVAANIEPTPSPTMTRVGPLRRESVQALPNLTYLIEQSPRDKPVHRSTGQKQLDIPQNLYSLTEESRDSSNSLSASGGIGRGQRSGGASPRHMLGEVTVHQVSDRKDVESISSGEHTTEL